MNFTELKNWRKLSKSERERLKKVYGGELNITKDVRDGEQKEED